MIYLDHAATSYPKPENVLQAIQHWYAKIGVSADRGDGPRTREARDTIQRVRTGIAAMTGHSPEHVAFCSGATEGLNLVLRALLTPGSRAVTTPFEHSSVARPLIALSKERDLQIKVADSDFATGSADDALCNEIQSQQPSVVVFTHASNVTGAVLDAKRVCKVASANGAISVLDASQTAGYLPINVGADVVISSCHKAMHGPPGVGFIAVNKSLELSPQKQGGTGSSIALQQHPTQWPQAFEAGTPNTPALFGLAAALDWLSEQGIDKLLKRATQRLSDIETGLQAISGIRIYQPTTVQRTPVLSFTHVDYDPLEIGAVLAASGIHARCGFHCAPWIHDYLGTATAGTVRIAPGPQTSANDVDSLLAVIASL